MSDANWDSLAGAFQLRCVGSGREAFVSVMEAADLRDRHDAAFAGRNDWARDWRILVEREVSP